MPRSAGDVVLLFVFCCVFSFAISSIKQTAFLVKAPVRLTLVHTVSGLVPMMDSCCCWRGMAVDDGGPADVQSLKKL